MTAADSPDQRGSFPTTHWSLVLHAGSGSAAALEALCRDYWYPLYAFARRQGRTHHEAEDCTQEFLARLLSTDGVARARPERGRFRSFLLSSLRNFLTNEWHRAQAEKRGGGHMLLPLEFEAAGKTFSREPADPALSPEQAFDRAWAFGMIERSVADLRKEYAKNGRGPLFDELVPLVWDDDAGEAWAAPAARLGLTTHAFTVALARLRQRISRRLRTNVAETVASDAEADEELRHLLAAVNSRSSAP